MRFEFILGVDLVEEPPQEPDPGSLVNPPVFTAKKTETGFGVSGSSGANSDQILPLRPCLIRSSQKGLGQLVSSVGKQSCHRMAGLVQELHRNYPGR